MILSHVGFYQKSLKRIWVNVGFIRLLNKHSFYVNEKIHN